MRWLRRGQGGSGGEPPFLESEAGHRDSDFHPGGEDGSRHQAGRDGFWNQGPETRQNLERDTDADAGGQGPETQTAQRKRVW